MSQVPISFVRGPFTVQSARSGEQVGAAPCRCDE